MQSYMSDPHLPRLPAFRTEYIHSDASYLASGFPMQVFAIDWLSRKITHNGAAGARICEDVCGKRRLRRVSASGTRRCREASPIMAILALDWKETRETGKWSRVMVASSSHDSWLEQSCRRCYADDAGCPSKHSPRAGAGTRK
jgi:hypothetical protein